MKRGRLEVEGGVEELGRVVVAEEEGDLEAVRRLILAAAADIVE